MRVDYMELIYTQCVWRTAAWEGSNSRCYDCGWGAKDCDFSALQSSSETPGRCKTPFVDARGAEARRIVQNSAGVVVFGFRGTRGIYHVCTFPKRHLLGAAPMHGPSTVRVVRIILILIDMIDNYTSYSDSLQAITPSTLPPSIYCTGLAHNVLVRPRDR